jgi:hypothetical protein
MRVRQFLRVGVYLVALSMCAGCSMIPAAPGAVGENYPGTCLPGELSWPTDFLESLPGESDAVGGSIVGLRLEYVESKWVWRLRSADTKTDMLGEQKDDPSVGRESIVDVRTLKTASSLEVQLSVAEQQLSGASAYEAAQQAGEEWPSPLIIEMARVMERGEPTWRITTCDTETNEQTVITLP